MRCNCVLINSLFKCYFMCDQFNMALLGIHFYDFNPDFFCTFYYIEFYVYTCHFKIGQIIFYLTHENKNIDLIYKNNKTKYVILKDNICYTYSFFVLWTTIVLLLWKISEVLSFRLFFFKFSERHLNLVSFFLLWMKFYLCNCICCRWYLYTKLFSTLDFCS